MVEMSNRTSFAARLRAGGLPPERFRVLEPEPWKMAIQVVVKGTFRLEGDRAVPDPEQSPILDRDAETTDGYVEGDLAIRKDGVDVVILGSAHAPRGSPVREMTVEVRVGSRARSYVVSGDRTWARRLFGWKTTDPEPFQTMSLGFERSFGGTFRLPSGAELPFMRNPIGKGWTPYLEGARFEGRPLPNLEPLGSPVESPQEEPDPVGFACYRLGWGLRMLRGLEPQGDEAPRVLPSLWNAAHPDWVLDAYPGGERLEIRGMSETDGISFEVPRLPVVLEHGPAGRRDAVPAAPDALWVLPERRRAIVVARWLLPVDEDPETNRQTVLLRPE